MRRPRVRFTVRRLMVVVVLAGVAFAAIAAIERRRDRGRYATVWVVNRKSSPLDGVTASYPGGKHAFPRIPPGERVGWTIRIETEADVRVEVGPGQAATFGGVRGGAETTVTFGD